MADPDCARYAILVQQTIAAQKLQSCARNSGVFSFKTLVTACTADEGLALKLDLSKWQIGFEQLTRA